MIYYFAVFIAGFIVGWFACWVVGMMMVGRDL